MLAVTSIAEEILELKRARHAVILAHHYQDAEIQDLADAGSRGNAGHGRGSGRTPRGTAGDPDLSPLIAVLKKVTGRFHALIKYSASS